MSNGYIVAYGGTSNRCCSKPDAACFDKCTILQVAVVTYGNLPFITCAVYARVVQLYNTHRWSAIIGTFFQSHAYL